MSPCDYDELLEDHQLFHSIFQIDNFIVGAQPTPWSRYKQAMRELAKRIGTLKELDVARKRLPQEVTANGIQARSELNRIYYETKRECDRFAEHVRGLKTLLGPLTPEKREQYERKDWYTKAKLLALEDYVDRGRLSWRTISFVLSFPEDLRRVTWRIISDRTTLYGLCEADYGLRPPTHPANLPFVRETAIIGSVRSLVSDKEKDDERQEALEWDRRGRATNRRIDAERAQRIAARGGASGSFGMAVNADGRVNTPARSAGAPEGEGCHGH